MSDQPSLARRLGTGDAVVIGLGSMVGAGVFSAYAPAAAAAGGLLLVGLGLAAFVAYCNATASAQLAAQYPTSGGAYVYGRERLGPWAGFLAGWGFVVGKTASCAAMALTFAAYTVPTGWQRPTAVLAVLVLAAVGYRGITRTARLTRVIVTVVLVCLAVSLLAAWLGRDPAGALGTDAGTGEAWAQAGPYGTLQAAGLLFFAFAGYARIATLGEEVREPRRSIPRAVLLALAAAAALYLVVALVLLGTLGTDGLARSTAPLADAVAVGSWAWAGPLVGVAAAAASLGALLALLAGVGRTTLAMARERDLPSWLAAVHPVHRVPHRAELVVAGGVCLLVLVGDIREVIGFSSVGVLVYYLVANLAAWTQHREHRRYPRALQVLGALLCAVLVVTLPLGSVVSGILVLGVGAGYRWWRVRPGRGPELPASR